MSPEMFSGWGVRTLATNMAAFNPVSYHNGSIWPHDNAICAAGLMRYGYVEEAHRVIGAQLDVSEAFRGHLPELFAGFARGRPASPASYPTSCSPQAWASASPLLWLRTLLRIDPWAAHDEVRIDPELPPWIKALRVEGIEIAGELQTVDVVNGRADARRRSPLDVPQPRAAHSGPGAWRLLTPPTSDGRPVSRPSSRRRTSLRCSARGTPSARGVAPGRRPRSSLWCVAQRQPVAMGDDLVPRDRPRMTGVPHASDSRAPQPEGLGPVDRAQRGAR